MSGLGYPCDMGDPANWQARGYHRYASNRHGIIVCEFCGEFPPIRVAIPRKRYGLDHPTWYAPSGFSHETAEDAAAQIARVYGDESGHVVVEIVEVVPK